MFDDLKENLKTQFSSLWDNLQEQDWFLTLREQYEVLPQATQKALIFGGIALVVLFLALIPFGNYMSASDFIVSFEDERNLTREFLKASADGDIPNLPPAMTETTLKSQIQQVLNRNGLKETQISEFKVSNDKPGYAPKVASVVGVEVPLKSLNVKQIKDIGFALQSIRDTVLSEVQIDVSSEDDHYYDVIYTVKNIALPPLPKTEEESDNNSRNRRRSRRTGN
ncbi:MAG: hypothetical protein R2827_08605 [Bdellovibrionales bacterium]